MGDTAAGRIIPTSTFINRRLRGARTKRTAVISVKTCPELRNRAEGAVSWVETRPENRCCDPITVDLSGATAAVTGPLA